MFSDRIIGLGGEECTHDAQACGEEACADDGLVGDTVFFANGIRDGDHED